MKTEEHIKHHQDFLQIKPAGIAYGFNTRIRKEDDNTFSWYIPSFDIYYHSTTYDEGIKRGNTMVNSYIQYWINKQGFRSFTLQIIKSIRITLDTDFLALD